MKSPLSEFQKLVNRGSFGKKDDPAVKLKVTAAHRFYSDMQPIETCSVDRSNIKVDVSVNVAKFDARQVDAIDRGKSRACVRSKIPTRWLEVLDLIVVSNLAVKEVTLLIFEGRSNDKLDSRTTGRLDDALYHLVTEVYGLPKKTSFRVPEFDDGN